MKRKFKYILFGMAGAVSLVLFTATVPNDFRIGRNIEILVNMFRDLNLFYVDSIEPDRMLSNAAAGMVLELDPYTEYISEEEMKNFEILTTGKYGGIGSLIRQKGDYVIFAEPYKDSPADRAGIRIGDRLIEIEGKSAKGLSTQQVSDLLKGEPGTSVNVKIERLLSGETVPLKIKREVITLPGIPYYGMVTDTVGYIRHSDFTEACSNDMCNAIMELKGKGAKGLILDYRGNGGGILQEAVKIISAFVPKGTEAVSMKGRTKESSSTFYTENEPLDTAIPIVILTDSHSASAAEIVSGSLQDMDRAVLIGKRTFGKGLVQSTRPLGYNSYLKLTTAKYYLPSGRCIQAIDYTKRNEDGSIGHIPDSLIREYATRNGRKVYDGGGIMPDVTMPDEYVSRFAYTVYNKGYIFDFVDEYLKKHHTELTVVPGTYRFDTDGNYAEFVSFMADKEIEWESESRRLLRALQERTQEERYDEEVRTELEKVEKLLQDDKDDNLQRYREELVELIENEIVLRYNYSEGVAAHSLTKDSDVAAAIDLLGDSERYRRILASQDTRKK